MSATLEGSDSSETENTAPIGKLLLVLAAFSVCALIPAIYTYQQGDSVLSATFCWGILFFMALALGEVVRHLLTGKKHFEKSTLCSIYKGGSCAFVGMAGTACVVIYYGVACQFANNPFLYKVPDGSPAAVAGLKAGDRILEVAGKPFTLWSQTYPNLSLDSAKPLSLPLKVRTPFQEPREVEVKLASTTGSLNELLGVTPHNIPRELTFSLVEERTTESVASYLKFYTYQLGLNKMPTRVLSTTSTEFGNGLLVSLSALWSIGILMICGFVLKSAFVAVYGLLGKVAAAEVQSKGRV
jgi:membrane-associated protease RseP (regulator of RpoE activity)